MCAVAHCKIHSLQPTDFVPDFRAQTLFFPELVREDAQFNRRISLQS
jgi:hypothetical protein